MKEPNRPQQDPKKTVVADGIDPKTLGKADDAVKTDEALAVAETPIETGVTLEQLLAHLPEKTKATIMKVQPENRLDIAKDYFSLVHPQGLIAEFEKALPDHIKTLAEQFMVPLDGKAVLARFSNGNGTETVASVTDPNAISAVKTAKGSGSEQWSGASMTTKDGKTLNYEGPGPMAKTLGYLTKGWMFTDTTDCFTKPYDRNNPKQALKPRFSLDMSKMARKADGDWDKSKGLHIIES